MPDSPRTFAHASRHRARGSALAVAGDDFNRGATVEEIPLHDPDKSRTRA